MFSIFNGRDRSLGKAERRAVFLQVSTEFRRHLYLFKGARLSVFMEIGLRIDSEGWAEPDADLIARETGYTRDTVFKALADLCKLKVEGHRVLLKANSRRGGKFGSNRYLIFPSDAEAAEHEGRPPRPEKPHTGKPDTENSHAEKPDTGKPDSAYKDKKNQVVEEPGNKNQGALKRARGGPGAPAAQAEPDEGARAYQLLVSSGQAYVEPREGGEG